MGTGETRKFVSLFGGARESSDLVGIARAACREGYAVIPVRPLTKEPMCTLTDRQRVQADRAAAHAARDAGSRRWEKVRHPCGRSHAITDPAVAERVFKRLAASHPDLNIGLEVGASRLVVVDTDTAAERESFTALWAQMEEAPELAQAAPTVRSPGKRRGTDADGNEVWTHKDGGHYWFLLPPEVDFAHACTSTPLKVGAHDTKASLMYRDQLVLVPPSVREEGPYVMASDIQPAPAWMIEKLHAHIAGHAEKIDRNRERAADEDDPVAVWSASIAWDTILTRYSWTTSGRIDRCGCEIWTRPGDWSSPKSATAHEPGCDLREVIGGVLHIWTDSPPDELAGRRDWSKLQVVAAYEHGGDSRDAMTTIGLLGEPAELRPLRTADLVPSSTNGTGSGTGAEPDEDSDAEDSGEDDEPAEDDHTTWWPKDLDVVLSGENPEPPPTVLARVDGSALFYAGKVNGIIGPSESGKSWIALEAVAQELRHRRPVLYLDFEDTVGGIVSRLRALGVEDELMCRSAQLLAYVGPEEALHAVAYAEYAQVLRARAWSLIVFDGVNAAMTQDGLDLISNTDATKFFTKITRPASMTGAAVVTIDHVPKDQEKRGKGGIGAQAKRATITGAAVYVDVNEPFGRGRSGSLSLTVDKDRPGFVRGEANVSGTWAEVTVTAREDGGVAVTFDVPAEVTKSGTTNAQAEKLRGRVMSYLAEIAAEVSSTTVANSVTGKRGDVLEQLAWLSENGYVWRRKDPKGRGGQLHSTRRPYPDEGLRPVSRTTDDDPFEDVG